MEKSQGIEKVSQMLTRKQYKKIKSMDRLEMERYLAAMYILGHEAGEEKAEQTKEQEQEKAISPVLNLIDDMYFGEIKGVGMAITNKVQAHARAKGYLEL